MANTGYLEGRGGVGLIRRILLCISFDTGRKKISIQIGDCKVDHLVTIPGNRPVGYRGSVVLQQLSVSGVSTRVQQLNIIIGASSTG